MTTQLQVKMNEALFVRDPENSVLGRKIRQHSVELMFDLGFEAFSFKKLAEVAGTTEASIYRYFENKHNLLVYLTAWYWATLEFQLGYQTNNLKDPSAKLKQAIQLVVSPAKGPAPGPISDKLHQLMVTEGVKAYRTKRVAEDHKRDFFAPYSSVCTAISALISACKPGYPFSKSLASTILEIALFQNFCITNLPGFTDQDQNKDEQQIVSFLNDLTFSCLR